MALHRLRTSIPSLKWNVAASIRLRYYIYAVDIADNG